MSSDGDLSLNGDKEAEPDSDLEFIEKSEKHRRNLATYFYTHAEDKALVKFILENNNYVHAGGLKIWKEASKKNICPGRSFWSLKERFRKHIVKNLQHYGVDKDKASEVAQFARASAGGKEVIRKKTINSDIEKGEVFRPKNDKNGSRNESRFYYPELKPIDSDEEINTWADKQSKLVTPKKNGVENKTHLKERVTPKRNLFDVQKPSTSKQCFDSIERRKQKQSDRSESISSESPELPKKSAKDVQQPAKRYASVFEKLMQRKSKLENSLKADSSVDSDSDNDSVSDKKSIIEVDKENKKPSKQIAAEKKTEIGSNLESSSVRRTRGDENAGKNNAKSSARVDGEKEFEVQSSPAKITRAVEKQKEKDDKSRRNEKEFQIQSTPESTPAKRTRGAKNSKQRDEKSSKRVSVEKEMDVQSSPESIPERRTEGSENRKLRKSSKRVSVEKEIEIPSSPESLQRRTRASYIKKQKRSSDNSKILEISSLKQKKSPVKSTKNVENRQASKRKGSRLDSETVSHQKGSKKPKNDNSDKNSPSKVVVEKLTADARKSCADDCVDFDVLFPPVKKTESSVRFKRLESLSNSSMQKLTAILWKLDNNRAKKSTDGTV